MKLKTITGLSMGMLAALAAGAHAQSSTPATGYTVAFTTEGGISFGAGVQSSVYGIGYDNKTPQQRGIFGNDNTVPTAESQYNAFNYTGPTASSIQIALLGGSYDSSGSQAPQNVDVSLYQYSPTEVSSNSQGPNSISLSNPLLSNDTVTFNSSPNATGSLQATNEYTSTLSLAGLGLISGDNYLLAIGSPSSSSPDDFAYVAENANFNDPTTDANGTDFQQYQGNGNNGTGSGSLLPSASGAANSNGPVAFEILTGPSIVTPEPGLPLVFGLGLGVVGLAAMRRRRSPLAL